MLGADNRTVSLYVTVITTPFCANPDSMNWVWYSTLRVALWTVVKLV